MWAKASPTGESTRLRASSRNQSRPNKEHREIVMRQPSTLLLLLAITYAASSSAGDLEPPGPPAPTMVDLGMISEKVAELQAPRYEFLGITNPVAANSGFLGKTRKCQEEFGATARLCYSHEVIETTNLPPVANYHSNQGWLHPRLEGTGAAYVNTTTVIPFSTDASGHSRDPKQLTCRGWISSNATDNGLVVSNSLPDSEGGITTSQCSATDVGAACCGPIS